MDDRTWRRLYAQDADKLRTEVERLEKALTEISDMFMSGSVHVDRQQLGRAIDIARAALLKAGV